MVNQLKEIIKKIKQSAMGLGAYNTFNLESSQAIIEAAARTKKPLIIQLSEKSLDYAGLENIFYLIKNLIKYNRINNVAIHLDHGKDLKLIKKCVDIGFDSVHFDGSGLPYNENVTKTKIVVKYAHPKGVWVQGEIGCLFGKEGLVKMKNRDFSDFFTDPDKACKYVRETKVNTLAIAVGTLHGQFKGRENIDYPRLRKIRAKVGALPLVLHGASGVNDKNLKKAIIAGATIFNLDTTLRLAFTKAINTSLKEQWTMIDPRGYLSKAKEAVLNEVIRYQKIFQ
jgi:fructose-bisphosphate aldolase, class II